MYSPTEDRPKFQKDSAGFWGGGADQYDKMNKGFVLL